jgi:hypothetical protein
MVCRLMEIGGREWTAGDLLRMKVREPFYITRWILNPSARLSYASFRGASIVESTQAVKENLTPRRDWFFSVMERI